MKKKPDITSDFLNESILRITDSITNYDISSSEDEIKDVTKECEYRDIKEDRGNDNDDIKYNTKDDIEEGISENISPTGILVDENKNMEENPGWVEWLYSWF